MNNKKKQKYLINMILVVWTIIALISLAAAYFFVKLVQLLINSLINS